MSSASSLSATGLTASLGLVEKTNKQERVTLQNMKKKKIKNVRFGQCFACCSSLKLGLLLAESLELQLLPLCFLLLLLGLFGSLLGTLLFLLLFPYYGLLSFFKKDSVFSRAVKLAVLPSRSFWSFADCSRLYICSGSTYSSFEADCCWRSKVNRSSCLLFSFLIALLRIAALSACVNHLSVQVARNTWSTPQRKERKKKKKNIQASVPASTRKTVFWTY